MSSSILEKLKAKPVAKKIEQVKIKIVQPGAEEKIEIKTKINDRTKENLINREDFLRKLNLTVKNKITDLSKSPGKEKTKIGDSLPKPPSKKVKKLPKKLKLVEEFPSKTSDKGKDSMVRRTARPKMDIISDDIDLEQVVGDTILKSRLPEKEKKVLLRANAYYMNNREVFINFINALFKPYKEEIQQNESSLSCDRPLDSKFTLLTHQKIVRDYLNLYTPYRGLILYHGLGSGKTCSSIAIAEGMKSDKQVIVMTPASLRMNYLQELKNCGDTMYRKNQYWEFIPIGAKGEEDNQLIKTLSSVLNIRPDFIRKNGGAWLVNVTKTSNYDELSPDQKKLLDLQINEMIVHKYKFISYNGLRENHLRDLTQDYSINPFDNKVIIIDEAHNFVSRIVNKLKRPESLSMRLYEYLLSAENCKIVLLTGTPMINYPNEIAILFNILRGYIKTWTIPIKMKVAGRKLNKEELVKIFEKFDILDYLDYKPRTGMLTVTKNPFGFINVNKEGLYKGVTNFKINNRGDVDDSKFIGLLTYILNQNDIEVVSSNIQVDTYKALDDSLDSFQTRFIDPGTGNIKNANLLKKKNSWTIVLF